MTLSYLARRQAGLCQVYGRRGVVMYQVASAVNPPLRQQDDAQIQVDQHLSNMEKWLEELNASNKNKDAHTSKASNGSDTIHRRRLIYLLETNADKLRKMNSS